MLDRACTSQIGWNPARLRHNAAAQGCSPLGMDGWSADEAEEPAHLFDERLRLLQRGEVAAAR